jgi:hypothetical protein
MYNRILSSVDSECTKRTRSRTSNMMFSSIAAVLVTGLLASNSVQASYQHSKVLLETNALGYTKHDPKVAYSDNYETDHETKGDCVNGPPPDPWKAPDAQTTANDSTCQTLVCPRITVMPELSCDYATRPHIFYLACYSI